MSVSTRVKFSFLSLVVLVASQLSFSSLAESRSHVTLALNFCVFSLLTSFLFCLLLLSEFFLDLFHLCTVSILRLFYFIIIIIFFLKVRIT